MENGLLLSAPAWAQATFGEARLLDSRRVERAVRIATLMATQSDVSLPRMMKSKAELKAAYRLLETPDVTGFRIDTSSSATDAGTSAVTSAGLADSRYH